ncbi:threonine/serine dehydratase [Marivibrio halodurans]|uniref:Threonine/serine dehydratase n=1 Tax=Marivibrio halodurans TaxID=2039722 RepID=A0A8J7V1B0_9PROT|nr:threonine/serine dehydratase [Marivibrio halodurans]MBP5855926.1 threonine/serine dehydratase [Marivibrio halodurans]
MGEPIPLPDTAEIEAAAERLAGRVVETPLLESALLNERVGGRVLVKPECLQRTGSFKFRGASNRILALTPEERSKGVVAFSSGNHAQGVALAARLAGVSATIVMPADAPAIKRANTEAYGATVRLYDRHAEDREAIGAEIAARTGATLVPPYDDAYVIAGQGTVGLEIDRQLTDLSVTPDQVLCCCGGGGLIAGTSLALKARRPDLPIFACEPEDFDDTARSLASGSRESVAADARSICDALMAPRPGAITFAINSRTLAGGLVASDDEVREAMRVAFQTLKLVVEPGGAIALAALLAGRIETRGRTSVVVLSGGNTDPGFFAEVLGAA